MNIKALSGLKVNSGAGRSKTTYSNATNPKISDHKKNKMSVVCKKHPDEMHSWLIFLCIEDQTSKTHTRKPRVAGKRYAKNQGLMEKGSSSKYEGDD